MNDEYLKKLYGWIKSNDSSYEGRYSYEQFSSKMGDKAYVQKMHGWITGIDPTFRSLDEFNSKIKKKVPMGNMLREVVHRHLKFVGRIIRNLKQKLLKK